MQFYATEEFLNAKLSSAELETAFREGKRKANRAKITLVGPGRAGKISLARSFINMEFKDTASTHGIEDMGLRKGRQVGGVPRV